MVFEYNSWFHPAKYGGRSQPFVAVICILRSETSSESDRDHALQRSMGSPRPSGIARLCTVLCLALGALGARLPGPRVSASTAPRNGSVTVDLGRRHPVSETLFGIFFEEVRQCVPWGDWS